MLLNHILTIEKAGRRKTDVGLCDLGECLYGTLTGSFLSSCKGRKKMGEAKVTRAVPKGVTKGVAVKEIKERTSKSRTGIE